jgi:tetratricopeptide (TPR) repeat protein
MKSNSVSEPAHAHKKRPLTTAVKSFLRTAAETVTSSFSALTSDSVSKPITILILVFAALCTSIILALILRVASPKTQITVSAFETFAIDQRTNTLSGKVLADLVVDNLHRMLDQAERFSGSAFSSKKTYAPVPDMPHIPVETSYGIEIKGVSLDGLASTWNHLRYHEFVISGDLLSGPDGGSIIRVRYASEGRANSFESDSLRMDPVAVQEAISVLALHLLEDINPEAAARYFMARLYNCVLDCAEARDRAVTFSKDWTNKEPENARSFFYLGNALMNTEHPVDALPFLNRAFDLDGNLDLALNAKGTVLVGEGKIGEAESAYKAALQIRTSPNALMSLGVVAARQGHYQEAESYYRKSLAEDPKYVGAYLNLGAVLLRDSKSAGAVEAYRQVRYLQPRNDAALQGLVLSLLKDGRADEALRECEQAERLAPDDVAPLIDEGIVYLRTKQTDRAVHHLQAIFEDSSSREAQIQLAMAYLEEGRPDSALALLDPVLSVTPDDARIHYLMARVLIAQGKIPESRKHADESERLWPGFKYTTLEDF